MSTSISSGMFSKSSLMHWCRWTSRHSQNYLGGNFYRHIIAKCCPNTLNHLRVCTSREVIQEKTNFSLNNPHHHLIVQPYIVNNDRRILDLIQVPRTRLAKQMAATLRVVRPRGYRQNANNDQPFDNVLSADGQVSYFS